MKLKRTKNWIVQICRLPNYLPPLVLPHLPTSAIHNLDEGVNYPLIRPVPLLLPPGSVHQVSLTRWKLISGCLPKPSSRLSATQRFPPSCFLTFTGSLHTGSSHVSMVCYSLPFWHVPTPGSLSILTPYPPWHSPFSGTPAFPSNLHLVASYRQWHLHSHQGHPTPRACLSGINRH